MHNLSIAAALAISLFVGFTVVSLASRTDKWAEQQQAYPAPDDGGPLGSAVAH